VIQQGREGQGFPVIYGKHSEATRHGAENGWRGRKIEGRLLNSGEMVWSTLLRKEERISKEEKKKSRGVGLTSEGRRREKRGEGREETQIRMKG